MEAAYVLTESIKKGDWEDYRLANPGLFLYWHSIELFLKGAMDAIADQFTPAAPTGRFRGKPS
jgi:hypothetical protein